MNIASIRRSNREQLFQRSAAVLLVLTATAKLYSVSGTAHILEFPDPLLGLPNRYVLMIVAGVELAVIAGVISRLPGQIKHLMVGWLGCNFLVYRVALVVLKPGTYCKCLGTLGERMHLDDRLVSHVLTGIALYLALGGIGFYLNNVNVAKCRAGRGESKEALRALG